MILSTFPIYNWTLLTLPKRAHTKISGYRKETIFYSSIKSFQLGVFRDPQGPSHFRSLKAKFYLLCKVWCVRIQLNTSQIFAQLKNFLSRNTARHLVTMADTKRIRQWNYGNLNTKASCRIADRNLLKQIFNCEHLQYYEINSNTMTGLIF